MKIFNFYIDKNIKLNNILQNNFSIFEQKIRLSIFINDDHDVR